MGITQETIYQTVDELRAIASMGLLYTQDGYDKERYERILAIALHLMAELEEHPFEGLRLEFQEDNWLHMSPAAARKLSLSMPGKSCSSKGGITVYGLSRAVSWRWVRPWLTLPNGSYWRRPGLKHV
jgi:hypothetical protein